MSPARPLLLLILGAAVLMALLHMVTDAPGRSGQAPEPEYGWHVVDPEDAPLFPIFRSPIPISEFHE